MFYVTYRLAELRRRSGRAILTALGLASGVGLVVIHDHDVARRAGRIVRMQDGRLLPAE
ncbi:MAG: hypothetical protein ACRDQT_06975 [Gaiellaceae bacterium]